MQERVSHTSLTVSRNCPYRYYLEYCLRIKPKTKSWPLIDGEALHLAREAFYKPHVPIADPLSSYSKKCLLEGVALVYAPILGVIDTFFSNLEGFNEETVDIHRATVLGMFAGYTILYKPDEFQDIQTEISEEMEVEGFKLRVKVDSLVTWRRRYWLTEMKSTSDTSKERLLEKLMRSWQGILYNYTFRSKGYDIAGTLFDVVRKTRLRKGKFESIESYCNRIIKDYIKDAKDGGEKYYFREPLNSSQAQLTRFHANLIGELKTLEKRLMFQIWPENPDRCFDYNSRCPFLVVCQEPESDKRRSLIDLNFNEKG